MFRDRNSRTIKLIYLYTLPIFMNILFMVIHNKISDDKMFLSIVINSTSAIFTGI